MNNEPESPQNPPTPTPEFDPLSTQQPEAPQLSARDVDLSIAPSPIPQPSTLPDSFSSQPPAPSFAPLPVVPDEPELPVEPPKKSHKKAIIIGLVVLLLIGAAVASYFLFFQPKPTPSPAAVPEKGTAVVIKADTYDTQTLIREVRAAQAKLVRTYPQSETTVGETKFAPAYKFTDAAYYVRGTFGESVSVTNTTATQEADLSADPLTKAAEGAAIAVLDSHKSLIKSSTEFLTTYTSDTVICTVTLSSYPTVTNCADTKDYKADADKIKPLAEAYAKVTKSEYVTTTVFSNPVITEKSDGYANATVSMSPVEGVGGFLGLYYAKDGAWAYWTGSQALIDCTEYNTYALQKSFAGDQCYDASADNENATVVVTLTK